MEKAKVRILNELVGYTPHSVVIKSILEQPSGSVCIISFDKGESKYEKIIPFDNLVQIVDGSAEIVIDGKTSSLDTGNAIIIPAHKSNILRATERFKMISTIIKSGYEI